MLTCMRVPDDGMSLGGVHSDSVMAWDAAGCASGAIVSAGAPASVEASCSVVRTTPKTEFTPRVAPTIRAKLARTASVRLTGK